MLTLVYYLRMYNLDLAKTLKRVAMPDYSQHCSASYPAIDVINHEGIPTDEEPSNFQFTTEYAWLLKNSHRFSYYESYPKDNSANIMWEPWHWQYLVARQ